MNANTRKALFLDAFYQVVDNSVFRILAVLILLPIAATFLLGFQEEHISLLFGFREWRYDEILAAFGAPMHSANPSKAFIEGFVAFVIQIYAGSFGVIFCIAATSFFVPRLIEKGAADVLFHKPVSRWALYLSRYFAGLFFVGLLSAALVIGVYLGLLLVSGHNDTGILWAAPGLVYLFGLIYAVCMLIGAFTRSTVASILLCSLFFFLNGCVHNTWITIESAKHSEIAINGAEEEEDESGLLSSLVRALNVAHFVLPKTTDSVYLLKKARHAAGGGPAFQDSASSLVITNWPEGLVPAEDPSLPLREAGAGLADAFAIAADTLGEPLFFAAAEDGVDSIAYSRRPRGTVERSGGRTRPERLSEAGKALETALANLPGLLSIDSDDLPRSARENGIYIERFNQTVRGTRDLNGVELTFHHIVFQSTDSVYTLSHEAPTASEESFAEFLAVVDSPPEHDWYEDQLSLDAPWQYNPLFSIGSSLAFTALMLALGWWKVSRIDF